MSINGSKIIKMMSDSFAMMRARARTPKTTKITVELKRKKNALASAPEFCVPCRLPMKFAMPVPAADEFVEVAIADAESPQLKTPKSGLRICPGHGAALGLAKGPLASPYWPPLAGALADQNV
jgi:hypothetical protein